MRRELGIRNQESGIRNQGNLRGKSFVFTGSLELITRDEAKERVRALGGEARETVSKDTDYVVAGGLPGLKYERAVKLGVKIIDEKEFLRIIGTEGRG